MIEESSVLERLEEELKELLFKAVSLEVFIKSPNYSTLTQEAQELLRCQLNVMEEYSCILEERISLFSS
ncbi:hypothetical protein HOR87_gp54 [Marinomonas phage CB5A]|uniref:Uncharacterized protein n=3 Tax=Murciavirus TaxID=2731675 RepID=A0A1W5S8V1_9CAUD|nr:hypothetical protein HOR72_gp21 [Marinomonas phage CPP1m]YP_009791143.1 hypothetical protein HOR87_gp54 [Marinomonas phage CB5A]ARB11269.1 hypothetical protein [Marinomonas phage CPP1m]ARB11319.1 hypothetical protein [Marinomonas phage CPG1g]ASP46248.1 hypothetical protein [Marinomonas phage CB5A]